MNVYYTNNALYDAVFIDLDGTLINTREAIQSSIEFAVTAAGLSKHINAVNELSDNVLMKGQSLGDAAQKLLSNLQLESSYPPDDIVALYRKHYLSHANTLTQLFPGTLDAIQKLSEIGVKLAVVTNKGRQASIQSLQYHGLISYFKIIVADQPGVIPKPNPQSFHTILAPALNLGTTSRILMIGDTATDIAYAHAIGAQACWVTYGFGDAPSAQILKPEFTANTTTQWANIASTLTHKNN